MMMTMSTNSDDVFDEYSNDNNEYDEYGQRAVDECK